jgi:hypothetical protein
MKCILRGYGVNMTAPERTLARSRAQDMTMARGTGLKPAKPRDLFSQAGPRGVLLNWRAPADVREVAGYRIYKDDEQSLFAEIRDPSTTQHFVEATAGSSPPITNFFISTISKLGNESSRVQIQAQAITEAGAPSMPTTPVTYQKQYSPAFNPRQNQQA